MFGIGFFELVVIAVVALVFVGPQRLPEVMKQAGKFFVQMRRTANEVKSTFDGVIRQAEDELRREEVEAMRALIAKNTVPTTATAVEQAAIAAGDHPLDPPAEPAPVVSPPAMPVNHHGPAGTQVYNPSHTPVAAPNWDTNVPASANAAPQTTSTATTTPATAAVPAAANNNVKDNT